MVKKGKIEEIFSKAQFSDNPSSYRIFFRDYESLKELALPDFLIDSNNFQTIPASRIELIKRDNKILFRKVKT